MANPYYTATGNPASASRGQSANIRAEYTLVQAGFDAAYAALLATSFAAALPAQAGNAWKFTTTDGTTAGWDYRLNTSVIRWADGADLTKQVALNLSGLTTGTTRTVTLPNKSGTLAMTSDLNLVKIATITPTAATSLDALAIFSSTYNNYRIVARALAPSGAQAVLLMRLANGGVIDTASNYSDNTIAGGTANTARAFFYVSDPNNAVQTGLNPGVTCVIDVLNVNDASWLKTITSYGAMFSSASYYNFARTSAYPKTSAVSGFSLFWGGAAPFSVQGTVDIYGYN